MRLIRLLFIRCRLKFERWRLTRHRVVIWNQSGPPVTSRRVFPVLVPVKMLQHGYKESEMAPYLYEASALSTTNALRGVTGLAQHAAGVRRAFIRSHAFVLCGIQYVGTEAEANSRSRSST